MLTIDVHTHMLPPEWPDFSERFGYGRHRFIWPEQGHDEGRPCIRMMRGKSMFRRVWPNCYDPEVVIEECQGNGVDVQVVCTVPVMFSYWTKPEHGAEISRFLNDHLASVVARYPRKFIALGTVPMQHTDLAIRELRRCKEELGFPGVQIGSHVEPNAFTGRDYDLNLSDQKLLPFFEAANDLDMSILVHPWEMMGFDVMQKYWLPWLVGMPAETSRAICSMIFGGVFEKYRKLKVCFAHGGGSFPFTIGRIEHGFNCRPDLVAVDNNVNPREYLKKDSRPARFWVDSIVHDPYSLRTLVGIFGSRRICMGSDYPFPLGEKPGELIINNPNISGDSMRRLLAENTLEFLGLDLADYANAGQPDTELSRTDS